MFEKSCVALITPFNKGVVDESALRKIVDWQIEQGTQVLVPVGTTGEAPTLASAEHQRVIEVVVEQAAGRVRVLAGAGSNNPTEAIRNAHCAERVGADGILAVAGYYNRPSQDGLIAHFTRLHDSSSIPVIIYNIPTRTIVGVLPETMQVLSQLERVVGVKDATGKLSRISEERHLIGPDFDYLSGDDITAVAYNASGGKGCISVTANVAPALCAKVQQACADGDYAKALEYHEKLVPLHGALFAEPSPAGIKYASSLLGLCTEEVRVPIMAVSTGARKQIEAAMQFAGLLS